MSDAATPAARAFAPVDGASLGLFRAAFGAVLAVDVARFLLQGWIDDYYVTPAVHFAYPGFGWAQPLSGAGMHAVFAVLGVCALGLLVGLASRACALLFALGFGWVFVLEQGRYLNHYYLVILVAFLLAAVPANRAFALDARLFRLPRAVPAWALGLLRAQIGLVYLYAGIAKLNADWLRAQPLRMWLPNHGDHPVLGAVLQQEWCAWLFAYGGLAIDLGAWPLLAWRRSRGPTFLVVCAFHLLNATVFGIGIFPWAMLAATTIFFPPDWPRHALARLARRRTEPRAGVATLPAPSAGRRRLVLALAGAWMAVQVLVPLRHFLYPGNVHWTEEGHAFAWHMMLRTKRGRATFRVEDVETGEQWLVDPRAELEDWQARKLAGRPDMILVYARHLATRARAEGREVRVYATVRTRLNDHAAQLLVAPDVDLARVSRGLGPAPWIRPFTWRPIAR